MENSTSVADAVVPHSDNQSKQHKFLTPPSHHQAELLLRPADVICAAYKYCSMQPGNIILNSIALDRHGGWKTIYDYDRKENNACIADILREVEASGRRSLKQLGSILLICSTSTKMNTVKRRLQQKEKVFKSKVTAATVESSSTAKEPAPAAVTESTTSVATRS